MTSNFARKCEALMRAVVILALLMPISACGPSGQIKRAKYTRIGVQYSGIEASWKRHGPKGVQEHCMGVILRLFQIRGVEFSILDEERGPLKVTSDLKNEAIQQWGKEGHVIEDKKRQSLTVSGVTFQFSGHSLESAYVRDGRLLITKNGKSVEWPCDKEHLMEVLGEPIEMTEKELEVGGP